METGQLMGASSPLLPCESQTPNTGVGLDSKFLYPMSHLISPSTVLLSTARHALVTITLGRELEAQGLGF